VKVAKPGWHASSVDRDGQVQLESRKRPHLADFQALFVLQAGAAWA
jgi:hypothetical protein